jgi:hypothetical protein
MRVAANSGPPLPTSSVDKAGILIPSSVPLGTSLHKVDHTHPGLPTLVALESNPPEWHAMPQTNCVTFQNELSMVYARDSSSETDEDVSICSYREEVNPIAPLGPHRVN